MQDPLTIPDFVTVTLGFAVFLLGARVNARVALLRRFNIPEAVSGGLLAALVVWGIHAGIGREIRFELESRDLFLVIFFASIGLNAQLSDLWRGGWPLIVLIALTLAAIVAQNLIGTLGAVVFGYPAQAGVLFGSAALIGGHGTALAWAPEVAAATGLHGAQELGVAVATLGLVLAALVGGPVAGFLIKRHALEPERPQSGPVAALPQTPANHPHEMDHLSMMHVMLFLHLSVIAGYFSWQGLETLGLKLPLFVPCLVAGIVISNLRRAMFPSKPPVARTPELALISEFALGAFLAMSLMSLQLWTLAELGLAIVVILALQVLFTVFFVIYVLFPAMGRGYRAAVLAAGFGGFALGATPTAIANMTAVTKRYGPSPIAFVVLPLVSAFFVDIANAIVIQTIVNF